MKDMRLAPSSKGGKDYVVTLQSNDGVNWAPSNCTCPGWKFRHKCRHADDVSENPRAFKKYKEGAETKAEKSIIAGNGKFRKPMLAGTRALKDIDFVGRAWACEEKYDGHRLIVSVVNGKAIIAWARSGKVRVLPPHLQRALVQFPTGLYDGELCVPHGRSYNVTELERAGDRAYVIFDLLEIIGRDVTNESYDQRREALKMIFLAAGSPKGVLLAESEPVTSWKEATKKCGEIWDRDGEGIILKDRAARYESGQRTKTFLKVKQLQSAVLLCSGFKAGKLGPHSRAILRDKEGNETSVKIRNFKWLAEVEANPKKFVGKQMRIDYQERTPDGGYRHPRMDRWEDR
jgi:ATP-dependent DNA ligase